MNRITQTTPLGKLTRRIPERYKRPLRRYLPHAVQLSLDALRNRKAFEEIETYCMFVGYSRSGHSLLGQLLNAHRHAVIAHEENVLGDLIYGYTQKQIFALLLERDRIFANAHDRTWTGYDYSVPDSAQGTYTALKVIGDKQGEISNQILAKHPEVFDQLDEMTRGLQLRVIHHVRNPYDNISTMARRMSIPLDEAVQRYFKLASQAHSHLSRIEQLSQASTIETHHEDLIADPRKSLTRITAFLNLSSYEDHLDSCADVVYDSPHRSRDKVTWTPDLKEKVEDRMQSYSFFGGYSFDN